MLQFIRQGWANEDALAGAAKTTKLHPDLLAVVQACPACAACGITCGLPCQEVATTCPDVLTGKRECVMQAIETFAAEAWENGSAAAWLNGADPLVARVSEGVNGPALEALAAAAGHDDLECVHFFRSGAPLLGKCSCNACELQCSARLSEANSHALRMGPLLNGRQTMTLLTWQQVRCSTTGF